jgi:hypothetical protein
VISEALIDVPKVVNSPMVPVFGRNIQVVPPGRDARRDTAGRGSAPRPLFFAEALEPNGCGTRLRPTNWIPIPRGRDEDGTSFLTVILASPWKCRANMARQITSPQLPTERNARSLKSRCEAL